MTRRHAGASRPQLAVSLGMFTVLSQRGWEVRQLIFLAALRVRAVTCWRQMGAG